jgi:hypothetical protein
MSHHRSKHHSDKKHHCHCQDKKPIRPVVIRFGSTEESFFRSVVQVVGIPSRKNTGPLVFGTGLPLSALAALNGIGNGLGGSSPAYQVVPSVVG